MRRFGLKAVGLAVAGSLAWSGTAEAQQPIPISVEVRPGVTFPTGDLSDASTGFSIAADVFFGLFPRFSLYGGYAWDQFRLDDPLDNITAQGPRGGVKLLFPMPGNLLPWVRGGLSYSSSDGLEGDPGGELGLEFGGGADYDLSPRFSLSPSLHYKIFSQDVGTEQDVDLSYLTLGLGAHFHF